VRPNERFESCARTMWTRRAEQMTQKRVGTQRRPGPKMGDSVTITEQCHAQLRSERPVFFHAALLLAAIAQIQIMSSRLPQAPKLFFCFPYRGVGGVSLLFMRLGTFLAEQHGMEVTLIDYADGFMAKNLRSDRVKLL